MEWTRRLRARYEASVARSVRRSNWRERIRGGMWFIPALSALVAIVTATVVISVDAWLGPTDQTPLAFSGGPGAAQLMLVTVAGAVLSFTAVVFSITIVALQLASSQFSPRVLRAFLRDRGSKIALGGFIATFVYAIIVLVSIHEESPGHEEFVPGTAVTLAFLQLFATIVAFIYFIHHIAHSIRAVHIIEAVAKETRQAIDVNYPPRQPAIIDPAVLPSGAPTEIISAVRAGAVVGIDVDDLVDVAERRDCVLRLLPAVGDYVAFGTAVFAVYGRDGPLPADEALTHVGLGVERTMHQDVAFGFRQLVDIAEKALSPAVNDPTTAVQAIDRLHDLLRRLAARPMPTGLVHGPSGTLRLIVPIAGWDDFVALAFSEIRHYGGTSIQVDRRLRAVLLDLLDAAPPDRRSVLTRELALLDTAVDRSFPDVEDREAAHREDRCGNVGDIAQLG